MEILQRYHNKIVLAFDAAREDRGGDKVCVFFLQWREKSHKIGGCSACAMPTREAPSEGLTHQGHPADLISVHCTNLFSITAFATPNESMFGHMSTSGVHVHPAWECRLNISEWRNVLRTDAKRTNPIWAQQFYVLPWDQKVWNARFTIPYPDIPNFGLHRVSKTWKI